MQINIGGVLVSRASLHNQDEIKHKDIREGDVVTIKWTGDVIPQIVKVDESSRHANTPEFVFPEVCPECGSKVRCPEDKFQIFFILEERLKEFSLKEQHGWGEKSIANLLSAIENGRVITLDRFIFSLGIRFIGQVAAELLANYYVSYDKWYDSMTSNNVELVGIDGIGEKVAESLKYFFSQECNIEMLNDLICKFFP